MRAIIALSAFLALAAAWLSPAEAVEGQVAKMSSRATFGEIYNPVRQKQSRGTFDKDVWYS